MATVNFIPCKSQCRASLRGTLDYVRQDHKCVTEDGLRFVTGKDCCADTAYAEFMATKSANDKTDGRYFYHYTQSFSPDEGITPEQAHQAALRLADHYEGYEVLVATHCDRAHIHSHLVINSVSFTDGRKLRQSPNTLKELRAISDDICREMGFTTLVPYEKTSPAKAVNTREYRAAEKGDSFKFKLMSAIDHCMEVSRTRQNFIENMRRLGYGVSWSDTRKHITYTTPGGAKCRDNRLHEEKYLKERMEAEFGLRENEGPQCRRHRRAGQALSTGGESNPGRTLASHDGVTENSAGTRNGGKPDLLPQPDGTVLEEFERRTEPVPESDQGDLLTGWEDARAKLAAREGTGGIAVLPSPAESIRPAEEAGLLAGGGGYVLGGAADLAADLSQVIDGMPEYEEPVHYAHERKRGVGQREDDHSGDGWGMRMR
ncbi:MAG: relaxase/mobilization nuclease domain-containing protein [Firmicutes bacterium]|nr:relaxase/mobilization nuclease domain-containing protein [Bacillota bacterium]